MRYLALAALLLCTVLAVGACSDVSDTVVDDLPVFDGQELQLSSTWAPAGARPGPACVSLDDEAEQTARYLQSDVELQLGTWTLLDGYACGAVYEVGPDVWSVEPDRCDADVRSWHVEIIETDRAGYELPDPFDPDGPPAFDVVLGCQVTDHA